MRVQVECIYCGHVEVRKIYNKAQIKSCEKCGDTWVKIKDADHDKVDYYVGTPPFRKESDTDDDDDSYMSFD